MVGPGQSKQAGFYQYSFVHELSKNEVAPLHNEDFTQAFVCTIGSPDALLDVLTFVHHAISFEKANKEKNVF